MLPTTSAGNSAPSMPQPQAGGMSERPPVAGVGGGSDAPAPVAGAGGAPASDAYDYESEQVRLDADLIIAPGKTVRVGPGTSFTAAAGVKVQVQGTLIVAGTAGAKVRFDGTGVPRSWHGIVVASGGRLELTHAAIAGATYGIHALPGSDFAVDYAEIGKSFKAAVVQSDGTFDHTRFHASGDPTFSPVNEVSVDDVNGTLTILDASPVVRNSTFDGSAALVDMVRVGGASAPLFDHVLIKDAHCGIHANGGANNGLKVTNSIFENHAYGLMVYATKPTIEDSIFRNNANDIGFCFDATEANAPALGRNFYSSGEPLIDASCFQLGIVDGAPAASANPAAGPAGL